MKYLGRIILEIRLFGKGRLQEGVVSFIIISTILYIFTLKAKMLHGTNCILTIAMNISKVCSVTKILMEDDGAKVL